jgi:hypothetical protein
MSKFATSHVAQDPALEAQRHAYNAAFEELDLPWHWDAATYELPGDRAAAPAASLRP